MAFRLSDQQRAVVAWVPEGRGHAVVIARAGTGKTSTALQAMRLMVPQSDYRTTACIAMFNRDIANETRLKLAEMGIRAICTTFHAAGWASLRRAFSNIVLTDSNEARALFPDVNGNKNKLLVERLDIPSHYQGFALAAMSFAKQRAFGRTCRMSDPTAWLKLVDDYELDLLISADYLDSGIRERHEIIKTGLQWAFKALKLSNELVDTIADHDDQLYGPLIRDLKLFENDWLIVDEAQDSNPARRLLARKMLKRTGRSLWIGDDRQAIYRFAGADSDALAQIIKEWNATTLKLTKTFRCPKVVVKLAQEIVPDYEAGPDNIEGEYIEVATEKFYKEIAPTLTEQTIFVCRSTAPLVKSAFKLIGMGKACYVEGKDIGTGIIELVNRWPSAKSLRVLRERLEDHKEKQTAKLLEQKKEQQAESLEDRIETIFAVIEGLPQGATVGDLKAKVAEMFRKTEPGEERVPRIRLMTCHRSKGLEEKTVVFIGRKQLIPSKYARTPDAIEQEYNLSYVGLTRAQERLIEVGV